MPNRIDQVSDFPSKVDVVVVGGGIVGAATAYELAGRGVRVALCEKGRIGGEQSSRNWGWIRTSRRDPREIPLMLVAQQLWGELHGELGPALGYDRSGIVFTCDDEDSLAENEDWALRHLKPHDVAFELLSRKRIPELFAGSRMNVAGGLLTPGDGRADPAAATAAIAAAAGARGVSLLTHCAVRGLQTAGGAVCGVETERGPIECSAVVLAGGAWSSLFAERYGLFLPQLKVVNTVAQTSPVPDGPRQSIWAKGYAVSGRADGTYTVASASENVVDVVPALFRHARIFFPAFLAEWRHLSLRVRRLFFEEFFRPRDWPAGRPSPFESVRVLEPAVSQAMLERALAALRKDFPAFAGATLMRRWAGYIDVTPDAIPVISAVESLPGFYISTGYSGHGFGIAPAAGRLMAQLVTGERPAVDPSSFRLSRFSDGSKMMLG